MTIAALPTLPVDLAVPDAAGATLGGQDTSAGSFAALVLAVLDTTGGPRITSVDSPAPSHTDPGATGWGESVVEHTQESATGSAEEPAQDPTGASTPLATLPLLVTPPSTMPAALALALDLSPVPPAGAADERAALAIQAQDATAGGDRARGEDTQRPVGSEGADATAPTVVPGTSATARTEAQSAAAVTRAASTQVVPELTRLVQAGPGTHRMVLRLDPEHLGEVRITLTVHPGGVRVRLATGTEDARVALSDGVQSLQRALESVPGRPDGETWVAVLHRPQDAAATTPHPQDGASTHGDAQSSPHQSPGDRPPADGRESGRPAGTQVDITARDGSQDEGASTAPRPADALPSSRSTRLDVSM